MIDIIPYYFYLLYLSNAIFILVATPDYLSCSP